jgi:hypothetical protein
MLYMGAERSAHMNPTPQNKTRGIKVPESAKTRRENVKLAVHGKAWRLINTATCRIMLY